MYRIINTETGEDIGFAEEIRYIFKKNGVFATAKEETATGIAYKSQAYSLSGTDGIDGLVSVSVLEVSPASVAAETKLLTDELLLSILRE